MKGTVLYGPRDVRYEDRPDPKIEKPTDAIIRISATCVCGSDLWPYRGIQKVDQPTPMGHEYCGVVEEVGSAVKTVKPGPFVIGSFCISDNTCPNCKAGYHACARSMNSRFRQPDCRRACPLSDGEDRAPGKPKLKEGRRYASRHRQAVAGKVGTAEAAPGRCNRKRDAMEILLYGEESVSVAMEEIGATEWATRVFGPDIPSKPDQLYKKPGYGLADL